MHFDCLSPADGLSFSLVNKRFVLAPRYAQPLPAIDWSADRSTVLTAISHVEDEAMRDILNKEFEARQALVNSLADLKAANERLSIHEALLRARQIRLLPV